MDHLRWKCDACGALTRGNRWKPHTCGHCNSPKSGTVIPTGEDKAAPKRVAFLPRPVQLRAFALQTEWHHLVNEAREQMLADIRAEGQKRKLSEPKVRKTARHMLELAPVDLHVGKLAWGEETGSDYDIRTAETVFCDAVSDLLERASNFPLEAVTLIVGNDLLQSDNEQGTTTAGTQVDTDSRYIKSFRRARAINSWAIREAVKVAPVHVVVVPGNHDSLTAFHLGEVLEAEFHGAKNVTVDNRPRRRKYRRYGVNLIGWTHGNEEKQGDLPLIMAQECPEEWALTTWREFHVGHLHKARETRFTAGDSFNGVRVRILPALCAADAWHSWKGYVGEQRACEAYLWDRERGYAGHLSSNVAKAA
jgi:hypothetical protein